MRVIIPTYRRTSAQHSFEALPSSWRAKTTFVVDQRDADALGKAPEAWLQGAEVLVHPNTVTTIASKRAWIISELSPSRRWQKIVMLDDDLRFAHRGDGDPLAPATKDIVGAHLHELCEKLTRFVHAGWSPRQGNNRLPWGWLENTRMMYVLGYHVDTINHECELGRIETREDMDVTLQLLRKGYKNAVSSAICADQAYNAPGGASLERTMERSNADAVRLAELHPGLVKVVDKFYKGSTQRQEVICYWKKAYEQGVATLDENDPFYPERPE